MKIHILPLLTICVVFFILGFATWVNAILIPFFKLACQLNNLQSYLVTFAFYISYLVIAIPAAGLLKRTGFKKGIIIGLWTMAAGTMVFVPAALCRSYPIFLSGLFIIGTGLAVLQTAANPYVTLLGSKERAMQRISLMGICNKTAGIIAPLLLAAIIIKPGDDHLFKTIASMNDIHRVHFLDSIIKRVIYPYLTVSCVLLLLGFLIRLTPLPEIQDAQQMEDCTVDPAKSHILHYPHLILGAVAIFFHVGSQLIAIDTLVPYAQSMGFPITTAKLFPSLTLFATVIGYLTGISLIPWAISQQKALKLCTVLGFGLSLAAVTLRNSICISGHPMAIALCFLISLGFANSMIWAGIWPLALNGLGKHTKVGASIMVIGLCGNAILPLLYGYMADKQGLQGGYLILIPCYAYLIFYAFYGYRVKTWFINRSY